MPQRVVKDQRIVRKVEASIPIIMRSGKYLIGSNYVLWAIKNEPEKIKAVVVASNPPPNLLKKIEESLSQVKRDVPVIQLTKTNLELGDLARRPHSIASMVIYDFGDAPISEEELLGGEGVKT